MVAPAVPPTQGSPRRCSWRCCPINGAGRSSPGGRVEGSTTHQLVADLEALRCSLGVARGAVLVGSWGTVLALRYAQCYPERITRVVRRSAFAVRRQELVVLLRADVRRDRAVFASVRWPSCCPCAGALGTGAAMWSTGYTSTARCPMLEFDGAALGVAWCVAQLGSCERRAFVVSRSPTTGLGRVEAAATARAGEFVAKPPLSLGPSGAAEVSRPGALPAAALFFTGWDAGRRCAQSGHAWPPQ